jgi:N-acetylglucosamine kinase-like BadF-type ATPase
MEVWLGIDAGGSRSVLLAVDKELNVLYKDQGSSIHARMMKLEDQVSRVKSLVDTFIEQHPDAQVKGLGIGIAGGGREAEQTSLRTGLSKIYENFPIMVTSDAHIAHAEAFQNGNGILIITGTGSMVLGKKDNRWDRAGGYGYLIGDPAGGYRLGQESLFAICTAMDGGKSTIMEDLIKSKFDIETREDLILRIYDNSILPAQIAPILLDAAQKGDNIAANIIMDNCTKLAGQVAIASETLGFVVTPLCVIGGLFKNAYFKDVLTSCLNEAIRDIQWVKDISEPALGACRLIMGQAKPVAMQ